MASSCRNNCKLSETQISSSCCTESLGPSLLEKLRCPKPSELARKTKVQQNSSPKGKRRARGHGTFDPKSVTPAQRVKEFPEESLCISNKKYVAYWSTAGLYWLYWSTADRRIGLQLAYILVYSCYESCCCTAIFRCSGKGFLIHSRSFNDIQNRALQDLVETSLMMQLNNREVWVVYVSFTYV